MRLLARRTRKEIRPRRRRALSAALPAALVRARREKGSRGADGRLAGGRAAWRFLRDRVGTPALSPRAAPFEPSEGVAEYKAAPEDIPAEGVRESKAQS